jgi:hypothetical protein
MQPMPGQGFGPAPGFAPAPVSPGPGGPVLPAGGMGGGVLPRGGMGGHPGAAGNSAVSPTQRVGSRNITVVETGRAEESMGDERRTIDNSGPAQSTRRIKVTKRWLRKYEVSGEETKSKKGGASLPKVLIVELSGEAEKAVKRTYALSEEEEQTFEEELELSVPPHTVVTLVLSWKRVWQEGHVEIVEDDGSAHLVPFKIVAGVTFDQQAL